MSNITFSSVLGRNIRSGDIREYSVPTFHKMVEAIQAGATGEAIELTNYFVEGCKIIYDLYDQWITGLESFLAEQGVSADQALTARNHLLDLLNLPDGSRFNPGEQWSALLGLQRKTIEQIQGSDVEGAAASADLMRESWRRIHDRFADWIYGYLDFAARRFGENHVEKAFRYLIDPFFNKRYARFNVYNHPWRDMLEVVLYLAAEAMHSHLVGPMRDGEFELIEEEDRWVFKFNPCGSGGRTMRGDVIEGTGPRMDPPYNYAVTTEEHDWAWNKKGVCYYCTQCCILMEKMPIEQWGYPVRIVEPPTYPDRAQVRCTWYVYKDLDKIPEEFYTRLGHVKPPPRTDTAA